MSRIQIVDLDTSSEDEETGGVVISKHTMQSRLGWLSTKVVLQVKQEAERMDTIKDEAVQMQDMQENQPGDVLEPVDTLKIMKKADDCSEMNKEQQNDKEQVYHIDNKEESSTKPENFVIYT